MKFKKLLSLLACVVMAATAFAQTGNIKGVVKDKNTGEGVIGANVFLTENRAKGAATDFEGNFKILDINPGTYSVTISSMGYETKEIKTVVVKNGETTTLNISIGTSEISLQKVEIVGRMERNTESAMLDKQRESIVLMDAISSQEISRNGSSDAASALAKVTGVTVEGSKYVFVRGLGDRYIKTSLNGAEVPGLDPDRNSVQMDLFPANLIDNLAVYKTFSPDMPGSMAGGLVNIVTKDFPNQFTLQFSSGISYNDQATFNDDFITTKRSKTDVLGFDNGSRDYPAEAASIPNFSFAYGNPAIASQINNVTRSFDKEMTYHTEAAPINSSHSFSIGDKAYLFGRDLGYVAGVTYQRSFSYYDNGRSGNWKLSGNTDNTETLNKDNDFISRAGSEEVSWGALANLSYRLNINHVIGLNLIRNQSGTNSARYLYGSNPQDTGVDDGSAIFETRALGYKERSMSSVQLRGDHTLANVKDSEIDWLVSYTRSEQDEPDLRFFSNDYVVNGTDTTYQIMPSRYMLPSRYFRNMSEKSLDAKLNYELPFTQWAGLEAKFKTGAALLRKDRDFTERRFDYYFGSKLQYNGNVADFINDANADVVGEKLYIQDASQIQNNYTGHEDIYAVYAMADLPVSEALKITAGARFEAMRTNVESQDKSKPVGNLSYNDVLPSVNMTYQVSDNMNTRFAYGRSVARPVFRELAPFASFDFVGGGVSIGNASLERTLIDNVDLRWEWYPRSLEMFAVSTFYKSFINPIEKVRNPEAGNVEFTWRNVNRGTAMGVEVEFRKSLAFLGKPFKDLRLGGNVTLVNSSVDIDSKELATIRSLNENAKSSRQMSGQSPYLVNANLSYQNDSIGFTITATYSTFGDKIAAIATPGTPNIYERSRHTAGIVASKKLGNRFTVKAAADNLFNAAYKFSHEYKGSEYIYSSYTLGRTYSLSLTYLLNR